MRELFGLIGSCPRASQILSAFNACCAEQGIDASMDKYPTTAATLPERLSEMFVFDRRGYVVGDTLQTVILPHLDVLDPSAQRQQAVDVIVNTRGILTGYWIASAGLSPEEIVQTCCPLWFLVV